MNKMIKIFKLYILQNLFFYFCIINIAFSSEVFEIEADKVEYKENNNLIIANGNAKAKDQSYREISSDKIIYFKDTNKIQTFGNSIFEDGQNTLKAKFFFYDLDAKIIEAKENVILTDGQNNNYFFNYLKYYEDDQKGYGNKFTAKLNDGSYLEAKNAEIDNRKQLTILDKAHYTTCSNTHNEKGEFCPSWTLKSNTVRHDKNKKKIIHKNSFLKIKNIPVLYSPYFSHPDPTVKRQSGLLPPLIKTISNLGRTIKIPYYYVISDDKDLTLSPIYYFDEKSAILSSYRQALKTGSLNIEAGFSGGYKRLDKDNRTKGTRNFIFVDYQNLKENLFYEQNEINFKLQRISQENFVRVNKINNQLFREDIRNLENSFKISSYGQNKKIELRAGIFENLDIQDSAKYTYYFPDGVYSVNNNYKNLKFNFNSYFQGSKFEKNQKQFKLRNLFNIDTPQFINKQFGISTSLKTSLFNKNIFNRNVTNSKENENIDNYFTIALDNSIPLANFKKNHYQMLTPRLFAKYTSGSQLNAEDNGKILNYSDLYSMNRTNNLDLPETGYSLGHGIDYLFSRKRIENIPEIKISSGIGQVISDVNKNKLPSTSSLNNKNSDFAGYIKFNLYGKQNKFDLDEEIQEKITSINEFKQNSLSLNYKYNLANDLQKINRNKIQINGTYNKFSSSLAFDEKNNHIGNERSVSFNIKKLFNNNYFVKYEGKKNLLTNNSEFHNFSLNFENDCITTSLALNREFYYDQDVVSSKSLILSIILKPFSDDFSPDLTSFIN